VSTTGSEASGRRPMPLRLRCPYCGDGISVELVNASPGSYVTDMVVDYIECDSFECRATWDKHGDVRQPSAVPAGMNRPDLMTHDEVAARLGIAPDSVRSTCRRAGIAVVHGYPRELVEALDRRRRTPTPRKGELL